MKWLTPLGAFVILSALVVPRAGADGSPETQVSTSETSFDVGGATSQTQRPPAANTAPSNNGHWEHDVACSGGAEDCGELAKCPDGSPLQETYFETNSGETSAATMFCPTDDPPRKRRPSTTDVAHAFKAIPMAASALHIQPPKGETLVNFDTIFFTDPTSIDKTVTVLDSKVAFHITVARYTWHYGDNTTAQTNDPGAAYPNQTITHRYLRKGSVMVSLDTTYQADYSIDGGPQQHLADTVTIAGTPQRLTVLTATPHLVGE